MSQRSRASGLSRRGAYNLKFDRLQSGALHKGPTDCKDFENGFPDGHMQPQRSIEIIASKGCKRRIVGPAPVANIGKSDGLKRV